MSDDNTHYTIHIPKFEGYKTLAVNGLIGLLGVVALLRPSWVLPDETSLGLAYDQIAGGLVAILGAVNILLRLTTRGPVPAAVNLLGTVAKTNETRERLAFTAGRRYEATRADQPCVYPNCRCTQDTMCAAALRQQLQAALNAQYPAEQPAQGEPSLAHEETHVAQTVPGAVLACFFIGLLAPSVALLAVMGSLGGV
jgi:hypothetical protein